MSWQGGHTLHTFAPFAPTFGTDNWVYQILGSIVLPIYRRYKEEINWIWVTRYIEPKDSNPNVSYPDNSPFVNSERLCRYVALRMSVRENLEQIVLNEALELARIANCHTDARGWLPYDVVSDLGKNRFIHSEATQEERIRRARLVMSFMDATVKLMLDSIVQIQEGKWELESNTDTQNPKGSFFESIRHLFANATGVPTTVLLGRNTNWMHVRTYWMGLPFEPTEELEFFIHY